MSEKARLVIVGPVRKGEQFCYECSRCHRLFILPDDRDPKSAAAELLAAFREHVREQHLEDVTG